MVEIEKNPVYWITGASSGLGYQLALDLARVGHQVAVTARRRVALEALAQQAPGQIFCYPGDITDPADMKQIMDDMARDGRVVSCAILNAGTYHPDSAEAFDIDQFSETQRVNLLGAANCLAAVMPGMIAAGRGHIVVVASVAGYRGLPRSIAYSASKAALIAMTESLAFDLVPHGIKVQLVCPGFVKTPLTDKNDFSMPHLMPVEAASRAMIADMEKPVFQIYFPKKFTRVMQIMRLLPWPIYYRLVSQKTRRGGAHGSTGRS